jgi:hypothetical protein
MRLSALNVVANETGKMVNKKILMEQRFKDIIV